MKNISTEDKNKKTIPSPGNYPVIGILEWFHLNDYDHVKLAVAEMIRLGVTHLRTGVSWADYHTEDGQIWYDWLIPHLSEHFNILPCFLYTPPSIGLTEKTSSPPRDPQSFADFLDLFINRYGEHFEYVELWNEPNNISEYDYRLDISWDIFATMISKASYWVKQLGKKTVLGGMSPIDPNWLKMMAEKNALKFIDVVGIHGFPDVFDFHWKGWEENITVIRDILKAFGLDTRIWITETGYSTWRYDERKQLENFLDIVHAPVERVYWYSLTDIPLHTATIDGLYSDEREYHFGMIREDGSQKLLYRLWLAGGTENIVKNKWIAYPMSQPVKRETDRVLITGGAGFIGTNVAHRLLNEGFRVTLFDNLSRSGVENNLQWLKEQHSENLDVIIADTRDKYTVEKIVNQVSHVFHFAAQVAVTSSLVNPVYDYRVNVDGTLNILEAIRRSANQPSLIFTSTNKVYGNLEDVRIIKDSTRYFPEDEMLRKHGIDELRRLDFHSPYGSSKGAADQYILDYVRSFGLRNVVFRMSCIYGPHQFGTEDQGWVAHFILKALKKERITLYGDGMQVRDILFIDDLVNAFMLAWKNMDRLKGEAFNIGGGPGNAISLLELISQLKEMEGSAVPVSLDGWRKGDQKYYVSNTSKFQQATGWKPEISSRKGIEILHNWLKQSALNDWQNRSTVLADIIR